MERLCYLHKLIHSVGFGICLKGRLKTFQRCMSDFCCPNPIGHCLSLDYVAKKVPPQFHIRPASQCPDVLPLYGDSLHVSMLKNNLKIQRI